MNDPAERFDYWFFGLVVGFAAGLIVGCGLTYLAFS